MNFPIDQRVLETVYKLLTAETSDLKELARIAGCADNELKDFYKGTDLRPEDIEGQDVSGMEFDFGESDPVLTAGIDGSSASTLDVDDLYFFLKKVLMSSRLEIDPQMIGREDVKRRILDWVMSDNRPIIISGGPGMGKSATALAVAYDPAVKARFGEQRYFVRLDTAGDAHALVTLAAAKLGVRVQNARAEVIADQIVKAIKAPTLLILDNLESPWDKNRVEVESVIARLAANPHLQLLLTIRGATPNLTCPAHETGDILDLNESDSLKLFHRATRDRFVGDADVPELMQVLAGHPLCIMLMAVQAEGVRVKDVLARWHRQRAMMLWKDGADHRLNSLAVSVKMSFDRLSRGGRRLVLLAARLPAGLSLELAKEILGKTVDGAALELLQARLTKLTDDRVLMLPPLREAILAQKKQFERDDFRLLRWFIRTAANGSKALQYISLSEALEIENLDAVLLWAMQEGMTEGLIEAQNGLSVLHSFTARVGVNSVSEGIAFWRSQNQPLKQAHCTKFLADIAFRRSSHELAKGLYEEAQRLYVGVGNTLGEANCMLNLGNIAFYQGNQEEAEFFYMHALPLYSRIGNVLGEANTIANLGKIALNELAIEEALSKFKVALHKYSQVSDLLGQANCFEDLGKIELLRLNYGTAIEHYKTAQQLQRKIGNVQGEANCMMGLGDVLAKYQDVSDAKPMWLEALALFQKISEPYSIGNCHRRLASASFGAEQKHHLAEARRLWLSIGRADLVAEFLDQG